MNSNAMSPQDSIRLPVSQTNAWNMKIAQIAPLIERMPLRLYGGTERIVSYLTVELVAHPAAASGFSCGTSPRSGRTLGGCLGGMVATGRLTRVCCTSLVTKFSVGASASPHSFPQKCTSACS